MRRLSTLFPVGKLSFPVEGPAEPLTRRREPVDPCVMRVESYLGDILAAGIQQALGVEHPASVRPTTDPQHGDYQSNAAMAMGKGLGKPPRELAETLAVELRDQDGALGPFAAVTVAGPGFVNLTLSNAWVASKLGDALGDLKRDGVEPAPCSKRVVVDYSGPNIAKQMHVGHLRSTILGDSVVRLLRFTGHRVVADNHLGDWGTQFGLLIAGMRTFGNERALEGGAIEELERVYREAAQRAKGDEAFREQARAELAKLQRGDPENTRLWERFVSTTRAELETMYDRLDVTFDEWLGESTYHAMLPNLVRRLEERGIARRDNGALCVFWAEVEGAPKDLQKQKEPMIVQKGDGAFLYSTTDIATLLYRQEHFGADRAIYVVDTRQALHFKQVFATSRLLGVDMRMEHVGFGTVLGEDGKPLKTRDGQSILLKSLLDEAEDRVRQKLADEGMDVPSDQLDRVAKTVGIGAVKYADMMQNRNSDYRFDWSKMTSFKGNSGPYLQYAYARIRSMFRKAELDMEAARGPIVIDTDAEETLAKQLLRFSEHVHQAAEQCMPHLVAEHLYAVAKKFSAFYSACPVLKSDGEVRESRLALSALTARQLRRGLGLLGISVVDRM